jgi:hypothetical protein
VTDIALDRQVLRQTCPGCGSEFVVVRGSVFESGRPIGLYLIALHGHTAGGRLAHLALAFVNESGASPAAAALCVETASDHFAYTVVDWSESPWKTDTYLGSMLDRETVLGSPMKDTIFHVAGHITRDVPEVRQYFA